jgi:hypothetical protein
VGVRDWSIEIDIDAVLRGQGADPSSIRARSPRLVELAEAALSEGLPMVHPEVHMRRLGVEELRHEKLLLKNGSTLQGALIGEHLGPAEEVVAILCTIGGELEMHASALSGSDMLRALALDGVGSAATEALANAACAEIEGEAQAAGQQTTIPLSPGMDGWNVEQGQPQIFSLFSAHEISIELRPTGLMLPRKSLSMVVGIGEHVSQAGSTCDYCRMRETCRYQDHYRKAMG